MGGRQKAWRLIPTLQRRSWLCNGIFMYILNSHCICMIQYFQICSELEKEEGRDQQQELLSKLIIFCIQDDGKSGLKWVRFHFPLQSLKGFVIHLTVALRTFPFGGNSAVWVLGTEPQLKFSILKYKVLLAQALYLRKTKIFLATSEVCSLF